MDLNRIINMVMNQIVRRVVNIVVDKGFRLASRRSMPKADADVTEAKRVMTPAELAKDAQLGAIADQAAQTAKVTGRTLR